jgi:FkbM family methyltransferase
MLARCLRDALFPMRWAVAKLPRRSLLRSACVPILKAVSQRPRLLASLPEIRPIDCPDISFGVVNSWVLNDVYWFGVQGYEGIVAEVWARLCRDATGVLEIGGNVGLYSVIGGRVARGRYTVVEPLPEVAAMLRSNLRRNEVGRVQVLEGAAIPEAAARRVRLTVPDEGAAAPTGAYLASSSEIAPRRSIREVETEGFPFSELVRDRDLIKIDAEGIEHALLLSAMPILLANRPTIIVEVLPDSTKLAAVISELAAKAGYAISILPEYGDDTIIPVPVEDFTAALPQRFHSKDVMLTPEPLR